MPGNDHFKTAKEIVALVGKIIKTAGDNSNVKEAGSNLGQTAVTLTKLINTVLLPFAAINWGCEKVRIYFQGKFQQDLGEKDNSTPASGEQSIGQQGTNSIKTEPEITSYSRNDVPEGLELIIRNDQKEIVIDVLNEPIFDILAVYVFLIFVIGNFALGTWTAELIIIGCAMIFVIIANVIWKSTIPLVRIKRECLHILRRTPFGETLGSRLHTNVIKNVRVVDSEVVVETDARKHTIGLGLNRDALEWLKNCILSEANVQRRGNRE